MSMDGILLGLWLWRIAVHGVKQRHDGRNSWALRSLSASKRQREVLKPQSLPNLLQRDTPPTPSQAVTPVWDQVFKHISLWEPFSFKPPHSIPWPLLTHTEMVKQSTFSLTSKVSMLFLSSHFKSPKLKVSSETQGNLLIVNPCKIKKNETSYSPHTVA